MNEMNEVNGSNVNEEIIIVMLKRIDLRLDHIEQNIMMMQMEFREKNQKIEKHVDFINKVYDQVKTPFHYIMQKIDGFFIRDSNEDFSLINER